MASSSLSQESLDHELNVLTRRNRVRVANRNRSTYSKHESFETTDDHDLADIKVEDFMSGDHVLGMSPGFLFYDHESPNRFKVKDKRWPGYPHKAKPLVKDKRKLREKRRSSGVMHVQSTEVIYIFCSYRIRSKIKQSIYILNINFCLEFRRFNG